MQNQPAIFEAFEIRRVYDEASETWLFSVIDIMQVLTQQPDFQGARKYWKVLKGRLAKEGSELVTNCYQLKMIAIDGKQRLVDVATVETLLHQAFSGQLQDVCNGVEPVATGNMTSKHVAKI